MAIRDYLSLGVVRDFFSRVGLAQVVKVTPPTDHLRSPYDQATGDPYADPTVKAGYYSQQFVQKGKVFQRWTYPFRGYSMPILEVPSNRVQRYLLAFEYFTSDSLCNASTRIKTEFALGGLDFDIIIEEDEWPKWTPKEWKDEYNALVKDEQKKKKAEAAAAPAPAPGGPNGQPAPAFRVPQVKELDADPSGVQENTDAGISKGDEMLPGGPRKASPTQDQPQITDVGKPTNNAGFTQPGQDMPKKDEVPATDVTPIRQFMANKIKLDLLKLSDKLDLQTWIIRFGQEAMYFGDAFANIVDALEIDKDGETQDEVIQRILQYNNLLEEIRTKYSQAYQKESASFDSGQVAFGEKVKSVIGNIIMRGATASISVTPDLLKKKADTLDTWSAGPGQKMYDEFIAIAAEKSNSLNDKRYTVAELQTLNPSATWVTRNDVGEVIKVELVRRIGLDAAPLNIEDVIHWKWQGPDWMTYGISEFFPAFRHIKLKRSLEEALAANAERYSNPIIQVKVGTDKVTRLQVPPQYMLDDATQLMAQYDRRSVLVTPYHYDLKIHGMEGKPLRLEKPLEYAVEQQISVLGIPKAFLWGDGGNFASVRAQFQTMIFRLKLMQKEASRILTTRIIDRYLKRRGMLTVNGDIPQVKIKWAQRELDSEQSVIGLINAFANLAKSIGSTEIPLSYTTIMGSLGHDYEQELYRKAREKSLMSKMQQGANKEQPPNQTPTKIPPTDVETALKSLRVASVAEDLNNLSWTRPSNAAQRRRNIGKGRKG